MINLLLVGHDCVCRKMPSFISKDDAQKTVGIDSTCINSLLQAPPEQLLLLFVGFQPLQAQREVEVVL